VKTSWCASLPVVTVPRKDLPKPLTMIYPYYENPVFLRKQMGGWLRYPMDLARNVTLIVVDDGSPTSPALDVFMDDATPFPKRVFRIHEDRPWNWIAARNIGAHEAADGWLLMTDMDHVVPEQTLRSVLYGDHDPSVIYGFSRKEHTGQALVPHPNSWLMTREMFWKVGGYDENFSGRYGSDGEYRRRCAKTARMAILSDVLIRHERQGDSSTTRYERKLPEDTAAVKAIVAARGPNWKPKTLSFAYSEVTPCFQ
jgi:hypothetical protein